MSSMEANFAVVICHGSYHTPEPFQRFLAALKTHGISGYCPQLPTSDLSKLNVGDVSNPDYDRDPPPSGYPQPTEDVEVISELLSRLINDEGKKVILIGHRFQAKTRRANGERGGIVGILYECAFMIPMGESVHSFFQRDNGSAPVIPPYCEFHKSGFSGLASTKEGAKYFFNDLDDETAKRYEATLTATQVPTTVLQNDAYTALPCGYLVTEIDLALPAPFQEGMIALQDSRPGVMIFTYKCPAGHSPHLSWTEGLVTVVREFAQRCIEIEWMLGYRIVNNQIQLATDTWKQPW